MNEASWASAWARRWRGGSQTTPTTAPLPLLAAARLRCRSAWYRITTGALADNGISAGRSRERQLGPQGHDGRPAPLIHLEVFPDWKGVCGYGGLGAVKSYGVGHLTCNSTVRPLLVAPDAHVAGNAQDAL
jgi:hypothetical protein